MADAYDVIVVGSGPAGYVSAIRCSQLGLKTAIVERAELGGICLNWGCIPTKALLRSSEIYHLMHRLDEFGFSADNIKFDLSKIVARSRAVSKQLSGGVGFLMKKHKITVIVGEAKLAGQGKVSVTKDGKASRLHGQEHHPRHRRARPRAAGAGAGRQADLDLSRSADAQCHAEEAAGGRLRRHRHRIRQLLPHARRRGHGRRSAGPRAAGRRRRDLQTGREGFQEAGHGHPHRHHGREAGEGRGQCHRHA